MDMYVWISLFSVMHSWISCTVLSAPAGDGSTASTDTQGRHVRTKRCSCATFLDKECVYFCHLDIIWVNTPERVVSYGLGDAPRTRRALTDSAAPASAPRCRCVRENDKSCLNFCRPQTRPRYEAAADALIRSPGGDGGGGGAEARRKHKPAADAGGIKRLQNSGDKRRPPPALGAALKTRLLLEKWRGGQHHRARAWEGKSTAS